MAHMLHQTLSYKYATIAYTFIYKQFFTARQTYMRALQLQGEHIVTRIQYHGVITLSIIMLIVIHVSALSVVHQGTTIPGLPYNQQIIPLGWYTNTIGIFSPANIWVLWHRLKARNHRDIIECSFIKNAKEIYMISMKYDLFNSTKWIRTEYITP